MSELVYWKMDSCDGVNSSAMRFKTKREALVMWDSFAPAYYDGQGGIAERMDRPNGGSHGEPLIEADGVKESTSSDYCGLYRAPERISVSYHGGVFDLMLALTNECASDY